MGKRSREKRERQMQYNNEVKALPINKTSLEKIYFYIIEWGTYLVLFTPLVLIRSFFFPFVSPKTIFFRIIVDVIFAAYILLVLSNRRYLPKINILVIAVIIFLAVLVITSFTGINIERSFWSTFERMTGLLTFFHLFAFFIILISIFRERKYWERILAISILVGVIISFYTLFIEEGSSRGGGTLGNTSFLSAYLLFDVFFAIILFFTKSGWWKIFCGASLVAFAGALFFNIEPTRGAIGGLFVGIVILILGYMVFSGKNMLKKMAPVFLILIILMIIGITQTSFFKTKVMDVGELPGESRKMVWTMAIESWKEKPWFGWGPENFNIPFGKYFNPGLFLTSDVWYDRVHNIVLDILVSSGILGLVSYLAVFGVAIIGLLKVCSKIVIKRNIFIPLGMVALLAAYFLQNIWVFDMISTYMMFFLSLAFVYFLVQNEKKEEEFPVSAKSPFVFVVGIILIIATVAALYFGNIQAIRVSTKIVEGITLPLEESITAFQETIKISPMTIFETPEQCAKKMANFLYSGGENNQSLAKGFDLCAEQLKEVINKSPNDFRYYLFLGRHYNDFYRLTGSNETLLQAEKFLKKSIELGPTNQQGYWSLAQTMITEGKTDEAVKLLQTAIDLEPRYGRSHWYLAVAYLILGNNELALAKIKDAEKAGLNWKDNLDDLQRVIEVYQNLRNNEELVSLYRLAIEMDPKDGRFWAGLAVAYANLGQFDKAREAAQKAVELRPDSVPQFEEFLKNLPQ